MLLFCTSLSSMVIESTEKDQIVQHDILVAWQHIYLRLQTVSLVSYIKHNSQWSTYGSCTYTACLCGYVGANDRLTNIRVYA